MLAALFLSPGGLGRRGGAGYNTRGRSVLHPALPEGKLALAPSLAFQRREAGRWVSEKHRTLGKLPLSQACATLSTCLDQLETKNPSKELGGGGPAECSLASWWG